MSRPDRVQVEADLDRRYYLLREVRSWSESGLIDETLRQRVAGRYERDAEAASVYLARTTDGSAPTAGRPAPPGCHEPLDFPWSFCPDCGINLEAWKGRAVSVDSGSATARAGLAAEQVDRPAPVPAAPVPAAPVVQISAGPPREPGRLVRELRPVFYENAILFLGAFLVFAGSVYFGIYFWDRLGRFGPLVAGGLLAVYGLSFAAAGYLLQRRYHAELSSRVLHAIATAILPVASTLLGEPLRQGGPGDGLLAAGSVAVLAAAAYPAIFVAASLFQREIGKPFARSFAALLLAIGLAPLVARAGIRPLGIAYVYAAAIPLLAMYRRVREVGRVFERATVVYVVGGSAAMVLGLAVRVSLALSPGIALAELAPLLVLMATAAIDLDVEWRQHSRAVRSALGVVGVLAHAAAVTAIAMAFAHPTWRIVTTLGAGLLFAVAALRHRRPAVLHLAAATLAAGALMGAWLPILEPPHRVPFGGLFVLPLSAGLARLGARWRRHASVEFAAPCERWAVLCPIIASLFALLLPHLGRDWQLHEPGGWAAHAPALVVLPSSAAVLALAWRWGRRRAYLAISTIAAGATVLVMARIAGAEGPGLALASAVVTLLLVGGAVLGGRRRAEDATRALADAGLFFLSTTIVILVVTRVGPWHETGAPQSVLAFVLAACAAVAVASQRPRREVGMVAVLAVTAAAAAALWAIAPHELVPGILALALLALDRTKARIAVGRAQPFADAYVVALAAVLLQVVHVLGHAGAPAALPPLQPILVALALLAIAARHRSPWPTYGAFAFLLAASYGIPAALGLAVRPLSFAKASGLALIVIAVGLRAWPKLRPWRPLFLDIPLHLAAVTAPFSFLRFLWTSADWLADAGPETALLLRRLAPPLAMAVLAAFTHGSLWHAYLAAAALVFTLPAAVAALGLGASSVSAALAGAGVLALIGVHAIARSPFFARSVQGADRPLPLFGLWRLPSVPTLRDLWRRPIARLSLVASLAAFAIALLQSISVWPDGSTMAASACALLTVYAVASCIRPVLGEERVARQLAAHAGCASAALLCAEAAHLLGRDPRAGGLVLLGSAFLLGGEVLRRYRDRNPAASSGARALLEWALLFLLVPTTLLVRPADLATPVSAAVLALAVVRYRLHHPATGLRTAASVATMAAVGFLVLWLLGASGLLVPEGLAVAALGLTAASGAWAHWALRERVHLGEPIGLASGWAVAGCALAVASGFLSAPASAPALAPALAAFAALLLAFAWFAFAAVRATDDTWGYAAVAMLPPLYVCVRTSPLGSGLSPGSDAIAAVGLAFACHILAEVLQRARVAVLARPAVLGARLFPLAACAVVAWAAATGPYAFPTLQHAVLAGAIGLLYMLGFVRGGHLALGVVALFFFNLGLVFLWIRTGRLDVLYYTVPAGASIALLARIYRSNISRSARRGLRTFGSLLVYLSTYYQAVQFDSGVYPLLLGGLTLAGILLGFLLRLRDLFLLSIGFLVLDVVSNLTYYGVHRPVLGWTLLTMAGLCLTASGILFQLRRAQFREFVASVRATLARWD